MRLLNLDTLELKEFIDSERPPYVILSHTWGVEEVSLQELQLHTSNISNVSTKEGYVKILNFCRRGKENGFEWGWVDTCCIDKTSSAELSEAINSTFRWYADAFSCYAYLGDVFHSEEEGNQAIEERFERSRWFTRGWTLQELLAPSSVVFYLRDWTVYGTKSFLHKEISQITSIPGGATTEPKSLTTFSVAQRISWVSRRQTTRPEDLSYCLLGILDVHMPLLYGEGSRAFLRLQEEILKRGTDPSIFAWPLSALPPNPKMPSWMSPLAPSPAAFRDSGNYVYSSDAVPFGPWSITNRGIRMEGLPIIEGRMAEELLLSAGFEDVYRLRRLPAVALIGCCRDLGTSLAPDNMQLCIAMYKADGLYSRMRTTESLLLIDRNIKMSGRVDCIIQLDPFDILQDRTMTRSDLLVSGWMIRKLPEKRHGFNNLTFFDYKFIALARSDPETSLLVSHQSATISNDAASEAFFVLVISDTIPPGISVRTDYESKKPLNIIEFNEIYQHAKTRVIDHVSKPLRGGKQVVVIAVPGMKAGERVLFVDISIRDGMLPQ